MTPAAQYPLVFGAGEAPCFDNFVPGSNREAVATVRATAASRGERYLFLAGPAGSGKTHLLIASARAAEGFYLDPREHGIEPDITENLRGSRLVCIDGIGAAAGHPGWEHALFRLFEELSHADIPLLVADRSPPGRLGVALPDLASRLASGPILPLATLSDSELGRVLVARAHARGFRLAPAVASYLVTRERRDIRYLLALLDRIDRYSLAAQRFVTIPLVRSLLEEERTPP